MGKYKDGRMGLDIWEELIRMKYIRDIYLNFDKR